jgi:hypothetical protein
MVCALKNFIVPHAVDAIVFVGMPPFYGFNVYLDTKIEGIQIDEHRWDYSKVVAEEDLCSELAGRDRNVYALKESKADGFREGVLRCKGMRLEPLGHFDADGNRIALFTVRQ